MLPASSRRFHFNKRSQLFIGAHNATLPVAAMCVSNDVRSLLAIYRRDTAPTPTGFAILLIVQNCFRCRFAYFKLSVHFLQARGERFNLLLSHNSRHFWRRVWKRLSVPRLGSRSPIR
jgi:hypothetical protein